MKRIFKKIQEVVMKSKQCITRTVTYLSIINSGMILFLFLSKLKELGYISIELDNYFFIIFFLGLFLLLALGWMDIKILKGIQKENEIAFNFHPPMVEMRKKINDLWEVRNG
jgi:hypothetical protein